MGEQIGNVRQQANSHIKALNSYAWQDVLRLLGKDGDRIMQDLILNCGIYITAKGGRESLHQLSGISAH